MKRWLIAIVMVAVVGGLADQSDAQRRGRRRDRWGGDPRHGVATWAADATFPTDVFTFVRIQYRDWGGRGGWGRGRWWTDYPDSDLNFSFRLQQLTSLKVEADPLEKYIKLTDDKLFDYPFIYIVEPGDLFFTEDEVVALRKYLLNGGFLMVDDFWGDEEWWNFHQQIKRVFPDREPEELPLSHPIFHIVYDLKEKPQIPSIGSAMRGRSQGITWERGWGGNTREVHYKAIFDDKGRMMAIICHNTDLGDGWEEEGVDPWYFREFSEKSAYPLGINIVFYAMTH